MNWYNMFLNRKDEQSVLYNEEEIENYLSKFDRQKTFVSIKKEFIDNLVSYFTNEDLEEPYSETRVNTFIDENMSNIDECINRMIDTYLKESDEGAYDLDHREGDFVREFLYEDNESWLPELE